MTFSSLEQRMAQSYLDMLPPFVPDENAQVGAAQQQAFYTLIKCLYQLAYDQPLLFVSRLHPDDVYPSRYKKGYGKPKLIADMRKFIKTVGALLQVMFLLGRGEEANITKKQAAVLSRLGIDDLTCLPAAWKWMATKEGACLSTFSHCLFDSDYPYTSDIYARLLGEPAFKRLESWMLGQGYKRFDIYDTTATDCNLLLTIANPRWDAELPRGGHEYKIRHTGISVQYDYFAARPAVFGLCIPGGMKPYLQAFDLMDDQLKAFVVSRTKKCNMCKYCVQTDKTGARPLARTAIEFEGKEYLLCNLYPGYNYSWTSIDDNLADMLIKMLAFMDEFSHG